MSLIKISGYLMLVIAFIRKYQKILAFVIILIFHFEGDTLNYYRNVYDIERSNNVLSNLPIWPKVKYSLTV